MFLVILIVVTVLALFLEDYYRRKLSRKYVSNCVSFVPVIGCAYLFFSKNYLQVFEGFVKKFEGPFYFRIWFQEYYFTYRPEEIKEILTSPKSIEKGHLYRFLQWIIPDALLIVREAVWKKKRRSLSKCFTPRRLNALVPLFDKSYNTLIGNLQEEKYVPPLELIGRKITDDFAELLIGIDFNKANDDIISLYKQVDLYNFIKTVTPSAPTRYLRPWLYFDFIYFRTKQGKTLRNNLTKLTKILRYIICERKEISKMCADGFIDETERNLIDMMLEANLGEKEIVADTMGFGAATSETTILTLALTLTFLGMYPGIQDKVYKEAIEVTGNSSSLNPTDMAKLQYIEMVLNETMRLFPPVPYVVRLATDDIVFGDRVIPKNTNLMVSIINVQRSEKYWKDPMKYDPDRFLPEEVEKRLPYTFLPFSAGPRNCIGGKFAMLVMKTIIVKIVKQFKITSNTKRIEDIQMDTEVIATVKEGIHFNLKPRITTD